ncbi:hypothetical protein BBC27_05770 [Acidithiobacillus ferrivorans]|uniref:Uncharacterized protein n=1 Tax=Acidithiobacillus ferrivorans TaxID=160808 RepID=A0A1B9C1Q5_9PROT|nr:hypothetical protein [Acidithiobacillus ferrivorans]OCB03902.1 hypothetical protein BBC27_05770 [Acidithiobacillus ferrivorans]
MSELEVTAISGTQLLKHVKELMKIHEIMDGSGSLYLKDINQEVTKDQVKGVQQFVYAGLKAQGIAFEEKKISGVISQTLFRLQRRLSEFIGPIKPKPRQMKPHQVQAKSKPTLSANKVNPRIETRQIVIQVTVKKARNFHYPRDLQGGDL